MSHEMIPARRLLALLLKLVGRTRAYQAMECTKVQFDAWLAGVTEMSDRQFSRLVDVIIAEQSSHTAQATKVRQPMRNTQCASPKNEK